MPAPLIPSDMDYIATIGKENGAWLLTIHEIWEDDHECVVEGGHEAWSNLTECKRSLVERFGSLRYETSLTGTLVFVYGKVLD